MQLSSQCTSQLYLPSPIPLMNTLCEWAPAEGAAAAAEAAACAGANGQAGASPALPRGAVVRIAGNNRTKSSLIGQRAVVQRAVGLGGWHHCVLDDGTEVKLQVSAAVRCRRGGCGLAASTQQPGRVPPVPVAVGQSNCPSCTPACPQRNALAVLELPEENEQDQGLSGESSDTEAREPQLHGEVWCAFAAIIRHRRCSSPGLASALPGDSTFSTPAWQRCPRWGLPAPPPSHLTRRLRLLALRLYAWL
jgi:hypothetical protein